MKVRNEKRGNDLNDLCGTAARSAAELVEGILGGVRGTKSWELRDAVKGIFEGLGWRVLGEGVPLVGHRSKETYTVDLLMKGPKHWYTPEGVYKKFGLYYGKVFPRREVYERTKTDSNESVIARYLYGLVHDAGLDGRRIILATDGEFPRGDRARAAGEGVHLIDRYDLPEYARRSREATKKRLARENAVNGIRTKVLRQRPDIFEEVEEAVLQNAGAQAAAAAAAAAAHTRAAPGAQTPRPASIAATSVATAAGNTGGDAASDTAHADSGAGATNHTSYASVNGNAEKIRKDVLGLAYELGFNGFCNELFAPIKGNDLMKQAIGVALFSEFDKPAHVLVVGEPAGSKSLAKDIIMKNFDPTMREYVGANVTKAGLVINLATGNKGVLAYADKKFVIVDEFDKIPGEDMRYCYELLSNGECAVHSGNVHETIRSNFTAVAFANPMYETFKKDPIEEIGLNPALISRFALIIKTNPMSREDRREHYINKFYDEAGFDKLENFDNWVGLARLHKPARIVSPDRLGEYVDWAVELVEEWSGKKIRRDDRMGDYLIRIPASIAKAEFGQITDAVLESAYSLVEQSLSSWKGGPNHPNLSGGVTKGEEAGAKTAGNGGA